ncbi:hypothetical protein AO726_20325 [Pseudomonas sp. TTU2014-080ASC]|uniref:methyl-accepting chemotaxis protein n=2 Tax=Pseudomonas sp. TTU2014-080ASC TaxID=1729724 RepID=UPI0007185A20|nr:methyl-accepting chemotaxis protein [Pseudomonas sp. TTU2014-080ASC]KRW57572.1 hypothetical protein AO726_20325 [Pseudomonas sp. TTU2014-080ASC]
MRNFSVRLKLYFLLVCFILSLTLVGTVGWLGLLKTQRGMSNISESLTVVDALSKLQNARLSSIAAMQEGASWRSEYFDNFPDKSDAIAEAQGLFSDILQRHTQSLELAEQAYSQYDGISKSAEAEALWLTFQELWKDFQNSNLTQTEMCQKLATANNWYDVQNDSLAFVAHTPAWVASIQASSSALEQLIQLSVADAEQVRTNAEKETNATLTMIITTLVIAVLLLGAISILIVRGVVSPLVHLRSHMEKVGADNDFTLRVSDKGKDEVASTAHSFNLLIERVQHALQEVIQGAANIGQAANQTSAMAQQVAGGAEQQNMAATDIASAVEQMSASVSQINSSAQEALARAEETANAAHQGVSSIELSGIESNKAIQQVNHTSQSIQALGRESERISSIISVITGIAEQINLLALNAAIEAARAGNHGRGFAVVADEVRSLALRTSTSAAEVREMVNAIQHSTRNAIDDMKLVVTSTEQSRSLIETASERMAEILQCAGAVAESINSVSQAMLEQHKSTELISQRVEHVAQMSQENCSISESAAAVSSELDNAASNLHQAIHRFKV